MTAEQEKDARELENNVLQLQQIDFCKNNDFLIDLICADCEEKFELDKMYKCLYCDIWYCTKCAETHFGQTQQEWKDNKKSKAFAKAKATIAKRRQQKKSPCIKHQREIVETKP